MAQSIQRGPIILREAKQYPNWLQTIKTAADEHELWPYIDPICDEGTNPIFTEPLPPQPSDIVAPANAKSNQLPNTATDEDRQNHVLHLTKHSDLDEDEKEELRFQRSLYERKIKLFDRQKEAYRKLMGVIQSSIDKDYVHITFDSTNATQMLQAVTAYFKPQDEVTKREILMDWRRLTKAQRRDTNIDKWLVELETTYDNTQRYRVSDISSTSAVFDLLDALDSQAPGFRTIMDFKVASLEPIDFKQTLLIYRNYRRDTGGRHHPRVTNSSFHTSLQGLDEYGNPVTPGSSLRPSSQSRQVPYACVCGKKHYFSECYYLNESARPANWKENSHIRKKIDNVLKDDKIKSTVDRALAKSRDYAKNKPVSSPTPVAISEGVPIAPPDTRQVYMTHTLQAAFQTKSVNEYKYELCDSFILDTGATGHVCNNRSRFVQFTLVAETDFLIAGNDTIDITGWGDVELRTLCPGWPKGRPLILTNVACVESFHCSVVSFKRLHSLGMEWSSRTQWLEVNNLGYCQTPIHFEQ